MLETLSYIYDLVGGKTIKQGVLFNGHVNDPSMKYQNIDF